METKPENNEISESYQSGGIGQAVEQILTPVIVLSKLLMQQTEEAQDSLWDLHGYVDRRENELRRAQMNNGAGVLRRNFPDITQKQIDEILGVIVFGFKLEKVPVKAAK